MAYVQLIYKKRLDCSLRVVAVRSRMEGLGSPAWLTRGRKRAQVHHHMYMYSRDHLPWPTLWHGIRPPGGVVVCAQPREYTNNSYMV